MNMNMTVSPINPVVRLWEAWKRNVQNQSFCELRTYVGRTCHRKNVRSK